LQQRWPFKRFFELCPPARVDPSKLSTPRREHLLDVPLSKYRPYRIIYRPRANCHRQWRPPCEALAPRRRRHLASAHRLHRAWASMTTGNRMLLASLPASQTAHRLLEHPVARQDHLSLRRTFHQLQRAHGRLLWCRRCHHHARGDSLPRPTPLVVYQDR